MIGAGERAYAYTKACGIIGKSFVGRRAAGLHSINSLSELERLVFDTGETPELSGLEQRLLKRTVAAVISVLNSYRKPPELLTLIRDYEYDDLKTGMDHSYYTKLWQSLKKLKQSDRRTAERIIAEEIALRNCAWALRLRTYYDMPAGEARQHLVIIKNAARLSGDALKALDFSLDVPGDWEKWNRRKFLNPFDHNRNAPWRVDPRYFQNAAAKYLYAMALRNFRVRPFSHDAIFCFIKLKQFEEDLLTSKIEGLNMGLSGKDALTEAAL